MGGAIKEILEAYKTALPDLKNELMEDATYADTKMRMILCAVEKYRGEIDKKIAEYDLQIASKANALEQLKAQKQQAQQQFEQAQKQQEAKQAEFDYWKNLKANIQKNLDEIKELKKRIEAEDDLSHAASMYFLALELQRILRNTRIVSVEELKYKLYSSWNQLSQAKELVRQTQSAAEAAAAAVDAAQKDLDELKAKRREKILEKISVFDQPEPQKKYQTAK